MTENCEKEIPFSRTNLSLDENITKIVGALHWQIASRWLENHYVINLINKTSWMVIKESGAHLPDEMARSAVFFKIRDGNNYFLVQGCAPTAPRCQWWLKFGFGWLKKRKKYTWALLHASSDWQTYFSKILLLICMITMPGRKKGLTQIMLVWLHSCAQMSSPHDLTWVCPIFQKCHLNFW